MSKKVIEINDKDFQQEVLQSNIPVLVDFWAPWCGPCRSIAPVIEELAQEYGGKMKFVKVNVDDNKENASKYNIRSIPSLIFFKNGDAQEQVVVGAVTKQELANAIKKVI